MLRGCCAGDSRQATGSGAIASLASGEGDEEIGRGEEGYLSEFGSDVACICLKGSSAQEESRI